MLAGMPHRRLLLDLLARHDTADAAEAADVARIRDFVRAHADCFGRANPLGHVTGSAVVVDPTGGRVLLTHHRKLDRWLQLGGHGEPHEHDPAVTALREAREESGLDALRFVGVQEGGVPRPLDVDVHRIPAGREPAHDHLDLRYLLWTPTPEAIEVSAESRALRWFTWAELDALPGLDPATRRAFAKARGVGNRALPVLDTKR